MTGGTGAESVQSGSAGLPAARSNLPCEASAATLTEELFRVRIQKLKAQAVSDIKNHEYELLNAIANDSMVTQAGLSSNLGIAIGSVNWYIKRLIHRGYIKVSHLDRTRLKYDLTTKGMTILTRRAMLYMRDSLKVYDGLRQKAKTVVRELKQRGVGRVYLYGSDEVMDIMRLTCIEGGLSISDSPVDVALQSNDQDYQILYRGSTISSGPA
jgi:DNA-binding MarR family transcriptional regulator